MAATNGESIEEIRGHLKPVRLNRLTNEKKKRRKADKMNKGCPIGSLFSLL